MPYRMNDYDNFAGFGRRIIGHALRNGFQNDQIPQLKINVQNIFLNLHSKPPSPLFHVFTGIGNVFGMYDSLWLFHISTIPTLNATQVEQFNSRLFDASIGYIFLNSTSILANRIISAKNMLILEFFAIVHYFNSPQVLPPVPPYERGILSLALQNWAGCLQQEPYFLSRCRRLLADAEEAARGARIVRADLEHQYTSVLSDFGENFILHVLSLRLIESFHSPAVREVAETAPVVSAERHGIATAGLALHPDSIPNFGMHVNRFSIILRQSSKHAREFLLSANLLPFENWTPAAQDRFKAAFAYQSCASLSYVGAERFSAIGGGGGPSRFQEEPVEAEIRRRFGPSDRWWFDCFRATPA